MVEYTEYVYDAEGRRVAKGMTNSLVCNPTANYTQKESYVLGQSGEHITEQSGSGAFLRSHVYANGQLLATYVNNSTKFAVNDWLGSKWVVANSDGSVAGACINLPFGDELICSGSASLAGITSPAKNATPNQATTTSGQGTTAAQWAGGCRLILRV